jgi:hypothetical protein
MKPKRQKPHISTSTPAEAAARATAGSCTTARRPDDAHTRRRARKPSGPADAGSSTKRQPLLTPPGPSRSTMVSPVPAQAPLAAAAAAEGRTAGLSQRSETDTSPPQLKSATSDELRAFMGWVRHTTSARAGHALGARVVLGAGPGPGAAVLAAGAAELLGGGAAVAAVDVALSAADRG